MSNKRIGSEGFGNKSEGNQWWRKRATSGREKTFESPEELWRSACEYFEYTDSRKWNKVDFKGKDVEMVEIPTDTPYTQTGLCIFLDITMNTWSNYRSKDGYEDFFRVVELIDQIIYTQKFEGATVGAYNSSIIARDLGLTDKTESKVDVTSNVTIFEIPDNKRDNK